MFHLPTVFEKVFTNRPTTLCNHTGQKMQVVNKVFRSIVFSVWCNQKRKILHVAPAVYIMRIRFHIHVLFMQKHIQSTVAALVQLNIKTVHSQEYAL